jgi:photosystem II stability/assembly factor-like uncharacterized protein
MLIRSIILLLIFPVFINAQGEWVKVNSPVTNTLSSLFLLDSMNAWAAGASGTIIFSSDGGNNWTVQNSGITFPYNIEDIHFSDSLNGWAVSVNYNEEPFGTIFLKTTDGGLNWVSISYHEELVFFNTIFFFNSDYGFAAGNGGLIIRTTDSGESWRECPVDSGLYRDFRINDLKFRDSLDAFACGGEIDVAGVIWRSTNGGESWWSFSPGDSPEPINEVYFIDSINVIGIGGDFEWGTGIVRSSDNGFNWEYKSIDVFGFGSSISFRNSHEVWGAIRTNNSLIYSSDSGTNWTEVRISDTSYISDLEFSDSLNGIACGYGGEIYKWKKTLVSVSENDPETIPGFHLYPNFPNPFNPVTTIRYSLPSSAVVVIIVYDLMGSELEKITGSRSRGINEETINMDKFSSGIYFYSVHYNDKITMGKMLLLK